MQCVKVESTDTLSGQAENKRWCLSLKETFISAGGLQLWQSPTTSPGAYSLSLLGVPEISRDGDGGGVFEGDSRKGDWALGEPTLGAIAELRRGSCARVGCELTPEEFPVGARASVGALVRDSSELPPLPFPITKVLFRKT